MRKTVSALFVALCLIFILAGCTGEEYYLSLPPPTASGDGTIVYSNSFDTEEERSSLPAFSPSRFEERDGNTVLHCVNQTDSWYFFAFSGYNDLMIGPLARYTVTYSVETISPVAGDDFFYCFFESDIDPSQGSANTSRGCGFDCEGSVVRSTEYCTAKAEIHGNRWDITMEISLSVGDYRITFGSFGACEYLLDDVVVVKNVK